MANKLIVGPGDAIAKYVKVTLNGEDVTNGCFLANEIHEVVGLFCKDFTGKHFISNGEVAKEYKVGEVVISLRDDAPPKVRNIYQLLRDGEKDTTVRCPQCRAPL